MPARWRMREYLADEHGPMAEIYLRKVLNRANALASHSLFSAYLCSR